MADANKTLNSSFSVPDVSSFPAFDGLDLAPGKFTLTTLQAEASTCSGTCGRATTRQCSATTAAAKSAVWSPKGLGRDPMALDTRRVEDAGDVDMRRCQNLQPVDCVSQEKTL